jgi:ABC-type Fe3+-siderophore transport system permease subunit
MNANSEALCHRYRKQTGVKKLFLYFVILLLIGTMAAGISIGASGLGLWDVLSSLLTDTGRGHSILWMLRLPRVIMATIVGFGL